MDSNFPNTWQIKKLGEIIIGKPQYGFTAKADTQEREFLYLRITDINDNGELILTDPRFLDLDKDTYEKYKLNDDDILIARSGSVGRVYLVGTNEFLKPAIFASYLIRFRLDKSKILPKFFLFFTFGNFYKEFIINMTKISAQPISLTDEIATGFALAMTTSLSSCENLVLICGL